jgi:2-phosphosulfolactate phosphatase
MPQIDLCYSPELIHLYDIEDKIVVVVDIFRATSCMVTAFAHGVQSIIPVATVAECKALQATGLLAAAERDAHRLEGFELDNSPFSYMAPHLAGQTLAVTTTNGTLALSKSKTATQVLVGAFLNIEALAQYLQSQAQDVLVHCAGWKGKPNMEDTLFGGALVEYLKVSHIAASDAALMAQQLYNLHKTNLLASVQNCNHVQRLLKLGIEKDIAFCLEHSKYKVVPKLVGQALQL